MVCEVGFRFIIYVGEFGGLDSVWEVICDLNVECIGYGVCVIEDFKLV